MFPPKHIMPDHHRKAVGDARHGGWQVSGVDTRVSRVAGSSRLPTWTMPEASARLRAASLSMCSVTAPRSSVLQIQVKVASQGVGGCLRGLVQPWEHMKACTFRRESHDRPNWHACLPIAKHFVRLFLGAAWLENFLSEHPLFCPKPLSLAHQLSGNVSGVARGLRTAENGPNTCYSNISESPWRGGG